MRAIALSTEYADVQAFQAQFNFLPQSKGPLEKFAARRRADQMREELREFEDACADNDPAKAVDALLDLVYFAYGSAVAMGVSHRAMAQCWEAVHSSNMAKEFSIMRAADLKQGIIKPPGWVSPSMAIKHALSADGF